MIPSTDLPYLEYECISLADSQRSKKDILEFLSQKVFSYWKIDPVWNGTEENPTFKLEFPSFEKFKRLINRGMSVYEAVYHYLSDPILNRKKYGLPEGLSIIELNKSPVKDVYFILMQRTNNKEVVRKNYEFSFKLGELFGISAVFEEVEDGFIVFYKTREDFENAQKDKLNPVEIKKWMQAKGTWNPVIEKILDSIFHPVSNSSIDFS